MRASDRAYDQLLADIQSGALAPGTVLAEVEQARRLGVSRTPLREALSRLAADGLLAQQSPRVTVVTQVSPENIRALFEARRALEETVVALASDRGDPQVFSDLAARFSATSLSGEQGRDDYYALISEFDAALDAAVDNPYLTSALRTVRTHLVRVRKLARDNPARLAESVTEHRTIAQAVADGDAELASHATHVHLHHALSNILSSLEQSDEAATHTFTEGIA
ncbi:GntR family transcriptional regulator [Dermacoccaceae bacterium W4C1]